MNTMSCEHHISMFFRESRTLFIAAELRLIPGYSLLGTCLDMKPCPVAQYRNKFRLLRMFNPCEIEAVCRDGEAPRPSLQPASSVA